MSEPVVNGDRSAVKLSGNLRTECTWCWAKAAYRLLIGVARIGYGCEHHTPRWLIGQDM